MKRKQVGFSHRARKVHRNKNLSRLRGVIAAEVHRLTHVGERVGERLSRLPHAQRHQLRGVRLQQIRRALERLRALVDRCLRPAHAGRVGNLDCMTGDLRRRIDDLTYGDVRASR